MTNTMVSLTSKKVLKIKNYRCLLNRSSREDKIPFYFESYYRLIFYLVYLVDLTCTKVEMDLTPWVFLRMALVMSATDKPTAVFEYPFRHLTVGPLLKEKQNIIQNFSVPK